MFSVLKMPGGPMQMQSGAMQQGPMGMQNQMGMGMQGMRGPRPQNPNQMNQNRMPMQPGQQQQQQQQPQQPPPRGGPMSNQQNPQQRKLRYFLAIFDYDPLTMSPNPESCEEELPFREGDTIKVSSIVSSLSESPFI
jgi:RIMS-binding protein 2